MFLPLWLAPERVIRTLLGVLTHPGLGVRKTKSSCVTALINAAKACRYNAEGIDLSPTGPWTTPINAIDAVTALKGCGDSGADSPCRARAVVCLHRYAHWASSLLSMCERLSTRGRSLV